VTESEAIVYVIDDDAQTRDALKNLMRSVGLHVEVFASAQDFLRSKRPDVPACLVLRDLRQMYEPHVQRLSEYLLMSLPPWFPPTGTPDTWQITAWERLSPTWRPRSTRWKTLMDTFSSALRRR
jgi:hypothetical protein